MSDNNYFTSRTSQVTNLSSFIFSTIITILAVLASDYLSVINVTIFDLLVQYFELPNITESLLLYLVIFFIWGFFAWKCLVTRSVYYYFEEERIVMHKGVLNKEVDYIDYFRIKDYSIKRSLMARIFNYHNIEIVSTDRTHPFLNIKGLTNFSKGEVTIRTGIENRTATGRGRELDVV
jgi:uncharacterized membrane protein YdbT with pleckstrin-like domain